MCNTVLYKIYMCNELYKCDTILLYKKMTTCRTRWTTIVKAGNKQNGNMASSVRAAGAAPSPPPPHR